MRPKLPRFRGAANPFDAEFADRYERERARWLRRRVLWYCGVAIGLIGLSAASNGLDLLLQRREGLSLGPSTYLDFVADLVLILIHVVALALVIRQPPQRRFLVSLATAVVLLVATITMVVSPLVMYGDRGEAPAGLSGEALDFYVGGIGLLGAALIHFFASMFVALTFRESLRQFLLLGGAFVAVTLLVNEGSAAVKLWLIGLYPFAGLPGLLWSWLRARRFDERFRSRMLEGRIGEMSMELAYARRVHEALFPPAVTRGPICVTYHYEPMREIGGDFLFVHPLSFPPAPPGTPLTVVLIDVSGHGVTAALAVNRLHGELQRFFSQSPPGSPGELLQDLNSYALAALAPHAVYASALCVRLDPERGEARWASAGHPPALLRRAGGAVAELAATAPLLGVLEAEFFDAAEQSIAIVAGDALVAYTDGLIEARDGEGQDFSMSRLRDLVGQAEHLRAEPDQLLKLLTEAVQRHRHGPPTDDTLIVQVTFDATNPPAAAASSMSAASAQATVVST